MNVDTQYHLAIISVGVLVVFSWLVVFLSSSFLTSLLLPPVGCLLWFLLHHLHYPRVDAVRRFKRVRFFPDQKIYRWMMKSVQFQSSQMSNYWILLAGDRGRSYHMIGNNCCAFARRLLASSGWQRFGGHPSRHPKSLQRVCRQAVQPDWLVQRRARETILSYLWASDTFCFDLKSIYTRTRFLGHSLLRLSLFKGSTLITQCFFHICPQHAISTHL